jgi:hypothetical protein
LHSKITLEPPKNLRNLDIVNFGDDVQYRAIKAAFVAFVPISFAVGFEDSAKNKPG